MFKSVKSGQSKAGKGAYHGSHLDIPPAHKSPSVEAARTNHNGTNALPIGKAGHGGKVVPGKYHKVTKGIG